MFNEKELIESIEYLRKGYDKLEEYLGGNNKRGILTNITNNILLIEEYVNYKGFDGNIVRKAWKK